MQDTTERTIEADAEKLAQDRATLAAQEAHATAIKARDDLREPYIRALMAERGLTRNGAESAADNAQTLDGKRWKTVRALLTPATRKLADALRRCPTKPDPVHPTT